MYFVPEVELRRIYSPDGTMIHEEFVYWKNGAAVIVNAAIASEDQ